MSGIDHLLQARRRVRATPAAAAALAAARHRRRCRLLPTTEALASDWLLTLLSLASLGLQLLRKQREEGGRRGTGADQVRRCGERLPSLRLGRRAAPRRPAC